MIKAVLQELPLYLFSILIAPKCILKKFKALQRNILWGATGINHKWDLVKWATVCKPKDQGGIGLRDPSQSNTIMGAKIWWQCLFDPSKPWASIWTTKYANHKPSEELIRFILHNKGSLIWNATKQHYQLI